MVPMPVSSCARRSGISPERAAQSLRRRLAFAGLLLAAGTLSACSREARAVRLPSDPGTDVYRITCRSAIEPCREKASSLCGGQYEVLENSGAPIEPPRVSSAPGPRSTGSRYQRPDWVGEIVVVCGARAASEGAPVDAQASSVATGASAVPAPDQLCVPGVTQLCLGPAACRGAQACLSDGRGYGPCDCGAASAPDAGSRAH
jgi:hypothetical protein